jgi:protein involved in polysaccharide export with SLBB domain
MPIASKRYATLHRRDGTTVPVDLLRFEREAHENWNPLLHDGDKLVIAFWNENAATVSISGAVLQPGIYEWLASDKVTDLVELAGGLLPGAELDSVQFTRFDADGIAEVLELNLSSSTDSGPELKPGDLVLVRNARSRSNRMTVFVKGEAVYPGEYPITYGKTSLSEVIEMAGGFSRYAFKEGTQLWRKRDSENLRIEAERIINTDPIVWNMIEKQFYRFNYRWREYESVALDAESLLESNLEFDPVLLDGDLIVLPDKRGSVLLMGQVERPGIYPHIEGWRFKDYIEAAGGYTNSARKGMRRLIRYGSSVMFKPDKNIEIGPGDTIFIPEAPDQLIWFTFKDIFTVLSQAATVIVVILGVTAR